MKPDENITYFGVTDFRNKRTKFGIKRSDRSRHVYIIGKTGMGKSTLLENMAAQDILNGEGMCFIDPHGSAIDTLLEYVPESRVNDVVYFAPFDTNYPISFNVMEDVGADSRHLVVNGLMASFKKIWQDAWSARMEYILTNTLLALLEYPDSTLLGVNRMLAEKEYRDEVLSKVTDASVKSFWIDEFGKWDPRYARESAAAIQNKIGQFTANPLIRNIIGQSRSTFDIRKIMDERKILLINLSKGRIGEQNAKLLGGMIITKIYLAAMSRADVGGAQLKTLPDFFFFVDEFQNFATESFADILSEARKYKLSLTIAHQYVAQMQEEVKDAVVGNVGTMITFRIGADDAELFEKQFSPIFTAEDIVNLGKFQVYLSLMIDGIGSRPFSALSLPPVERPENSYLNQVIEASRRQYAKERTIVEQEINDWFLPIKKPERRVIGENKEPRALDQMMQGGFMKASGEEKKKPASFVVPLVKQVVQTQAYVETPTPEVERDIEDELYPLSAEQEMRKVVSDKLSGLLDTMTTKSEVVTPKNRPDIVSRETTTGDQSQQVVIMQKTVNSAPTKVPAENHQKTVPAPTKKQVVRETQTSTRSTLKDLLAKVTSSSNAPSTPTKAPRAVDIPGVQETVRVPETPKVEPVVQINELSKNGPTVQITEAPKVSNFQTTPETLKQTANTQGIPVAPNSTPSTQEIPENVLRDILS